MCSVLVQALRPGNSTYVHLYVFVAVRVTERGLSNRGQCPRPRVLWDALSSFFDERPPPIVCRHREESSGSILRVRAQPKRIAVAREPVFPQLIGTA
jgi:hypothetical protein